MADISFDDLVPKQPTTPAVSFDDLVPPKNPPTVAGDVAKSIPSGVVRGAAETAMLPVTLGRMTGEMQDAASRYLVDTIDGWVRSWKGEPQHTEEQRQTFLHPQTTEEGPIAKAQDAVRGVMDDYLYEPKTTPGKYAETISEFAAPGGLPSRGTQLAEGVARRAASYAGDLTRNVVVPGVVSETAGQLTEGTPFEPIARAAGAIAGNVGATMASAARAPERVLRSAIGDPNLIDWDRATQLQNNSTGVRLTGPEAITQASNGGTALPNVQRLVEGSNAGRALTAPFFAERPAQVDTAVYNLLDLIAPQNGNPSVLGPRASEAATNAIRDVERARTAAVQPTYAAANADLVPEDVVRGILANIDNAVAGDQTGILGGVLGDLRNRLIAEPARAGQPSVRTPVTGPDGQITRYTMTPAVPGTPEVPVVDVGNLDRVRKYFRDRMDLPQIGQDAITKEQNAAVSAILDQIDNAMENASPNFAAGKQQYADITRNTVEPISEGPLGRVAAADTTGSAGNALIPQNPLTGSGDETIDAVRRLIGQDPETTSALIRQTVADRYAKAAIDTMEGNREFAGAKFRRDMVGNQPRDELIYAIFRGLPDQAAAEAAPELFDVLQATGRRKPIGSATEFNRTANADLSQAPFVSRAANAIGTLGASFFTNAGDALRRAALRGGVSQLAQLFTDPRSVELIREAAERGAPGGIAEAFGRGAVQSTIGARQR
ncbi:hypothetical protein [Rhizobium sp. WYJ-E13]|uniref:hypothetical protein n=1 Tax=Rhizobium sp. WYJ-E13 TaxID=2849093 RepID=UPI001C1EF4A0|nr:hypothetical protein [Rhizobium sp. WYJ-E13]QWW67962.1 hypothetical protein KQ933_20650 [Rhizobium sp. WYJ-E13]